MTWLANAALMFLIVGLVLAAPVLLGTPPTDARAPVLAVIPPWRNAPEVIAVAGGHMIDSRFGGFFSIALPGDDSFVERMLTSGAWRMLDEGVNASWICRR